MWEYDRANSSLCGVWEAKEKREKRDQGPKIPFKGMPQSPNILSLNFS
jgi:hypothetical protein